MRIDNFLNITNICKRRSVAEDMCKNGIVLINENVAKPSKKVNVGDKIKINFLDSSVIYEVLALPETKTISKSLKDQYVKQIL